MNTPPPTKKRKSGRPPKQEAKRDGAEDDTHGAGPSGREARAAAERKWPKGILASKLPGLMYACGDSREPYQESVDLVEQLALDYLMRMVHKASAASITNKIGYDDVLMILRQDPGKFARARELIDLRAAYDEKKSDYDARNEVNDEFIKKVEEEEGAGGDE